jgi:alpha-N-arabinofuranosidase
VDFQNRHAARTWTRRQFMQGMGAASVALGSGSGLAAANPAEPAQGASEPPIRATLKIDLERRLGEVDPNLYGNFIEHIGRCIYGGIYEPDSPLADADGDRKDVLDAARKLRVTQLRWPGGNFASGYHWQDGIGPKAKRPARYNLAWFQLEPNQFGTDEFLKVCGKIGAEPYLCVNMGTGTMDEASHWVEYCNHPGGTYYSDLRKQNGHAEPYKVKYWGLGNEMWGSWQIGHKDAADYAKAAVEFAKVMKWMDPRIKLIACGNGDPDWDRPVLQALAQHADYISVHYYALTDELKDYYEILGSTAELDSLLCASAATAREVSAKARRSTPIYTALDEWNILYNWSDGAKRNDVHKFEVPYNLRDALWVAAAFNVIHRHCASVRFANLAQLVNVIAPIQTQPDSMLLLTTYYPLQLYASRAGRIVLNVLNESPRFSTRNFGEQPYLDVMGTYDEARRIVKLAVVNRRKEGDALATIQFEGLPAKGPGRAFLMTAPNLDAQNTLDHPHTVSIREAHFTGSGDRWQYRFPRHSITWLEFSV